MTSEQEFTRNGLTLVVPQDVPGAARDAFVRLCCMGVWHELETKSGGTKVAATAAPQAVAAAEYPLERLEG